MNFVKVAAGLLLLLFLGSCYKFVTAVVFPPKDFPRNIPTIPFYYTLIPLFRTVDQEQLYHTYLEKPLTDKGAVNIYFGGRWNVLITRPAYVAQVLKHDEVFRKAGNQVKSPRSVLALYTGENIISAAGDTWKHFTSVMKPGLQGDVETSIIIKNMDILVRILLQEQDKNGQVEMQDHIQAYALANVSEALLGSDFEVRNHSYDAQY